MYLSLRWRVVPSARDLVQMDQSELSMKPRCERSLQLAPGRSRAYEDANFKPNLSFFTRLSTAEAHVCAVKFIGLYGNVGLIAIRDFSL